MIGGIVERLDGRSLSWRGPQPGPLEGEYGEGMVIT